MKKTFVIIIWILFLVMTTIMLLVTAIIGFLKGRQEQYFVQKPIFDPGENA